jgi:predicted MPP superfamily phosphohydrolase
MVETFYDIPNLPLERLAVASDLHNHPYEAVLSSLRERRPQLIAIPGDLVQSVQPSNRELVTLEQKNVLPFLEECAKIAPTFYSLGNHEWMLCQEDLDLLRSTGAVLLDSAYATLTLAGRRLVIGGLTSVAVTSCRVHRHSLGEDAPRYPRMNRYYHFRNPRRYWLQRFEATPGYHILLSHHPEYYPLHLAHRPIELILSGHAHGGQWRVFGRGVFCPGQGLFPPFTQGVVDNRLVISRGLANHSWVPRLNNPPELVYLEGV